MNELISTKELCKWLSISPNTANNWRRLGIPYVQNGSHSIKYNKNEVRKWMLTQNIATNIPKNETGSVNDQLADSIMPILHMAGLSKEDFLLKTLKNKDLNNTEATIEELVSKLQGFLISGTGAIVDNVRLMDTMNLCKCDLMVQQNNFHSDEKTKEELEDKVSDLY
ncbi:MAG: helix-turn-helix domain-containing protein, partial [Candidatus Lokiarchaeota archaeon]|nr:helix-turn-helix domain-containing protein [Candidatus Lokiarchaeota archaeon]